MGRAAVRPVTFLPAEAVAKATADAARPLASSAYDSCSGPSTVPGIFDAQAKQSRALPVHVDAAAAVALAERPETSRLSLTVSLPS